MAKYKQVTETFTVADGLDTSEIEELKDEMEIWRSNMDGTALENTQKYQDVSQAEDELGKVDEIRFDEIWSALGDLDGLDEETLGKIEYQCSQLKVRSKRQYPSRATRLSNACAMIEGALEALKNHLEGLELGDLEEPGRISEATNLIDDILNIINDFDGVEFPGMYG